ncbi:DUF4153 domain-containing protein [Actinomarinicola tropica]|uniref:DUF4153 domain-containing protein n=1 Tax=Actinomarinicola tropica TaxID=2789776 RepID=UPI00189ACC4F|nr:DUF4173 domain-containing protein [Actinomarinicola tropica]
MNQADGGAVSIDDGAAAAVPSPPRGGSSRTTARWTLVALLAAGVATDLVLRSRIDGAAGTAGVVAVVGAVLVGGRVANRQARAVLATAALVALVLVVRRSPWLVAVDVVALAGLLLLGTTLARSGSLLDLRLGALLHRGLRVVVGGLEAPALVLDRLAAAVPLTSEPARGRLRVAARGVGLALPVVVVVGALLASADAVFASFFSLPVDPAAWLGHLLLTLAGVWAAAAVLWLALDDRDAPAAPVGPQLGVVEGTIVLGSLVALYSLFVLAQVVAEVGGDSYVLRTTGLTAAEHARSGFFQLLWAAGVTLAVILGIHRAAGPSARGSRVLAVLQVAAAVLTVAVVGVAVRRLGLYEDAFGLTILRFVSTVAAWWLGVVMLLTAVYVSRPWRRTWLPAAVGASALIVLVGLNVANPERIVVEHNLARSSDGRHVDVGYLLGLSDDAVPALVDASASAPPEVRGQIAATLCARQRVRNEDPWFAANLAAHRAERSLTDLCGPG